nr:hypothetical protein [Tanacetum cinerariifolium]
MEYLVNISKRRAFWSLNEDLLKINDSDYPYAVSIKEEQRICAYASPDTTKNSSLIRRIQDCQYVIYKGLSAAKPPSWWRSDDGTATTAAPCGVRIVALSAAKPPSWWRSDDGTPPQPHLVVSSCDGATPWGVSQCTASGIPLRCYEFWAVIDWYQSTGYRELALGYDFTLLRLSYDVLLLILYRCRMIPQLVIILEGEMCTSGSQFLFYVTVLVLPFSLPFRLGIELRGVAIHIWNIVPNSRETPSWREIVSLTVLVKLASFT